MGMDKNEPPPPLLALSTQTLGNLDPNDSDAISNLWTVFSKCSQSLENGRRLENLSWRLWNRELLFSPDQSANTTASLQPPAVHRAPSLDFASSEESLDSMASADSSRLERSRPKQLSSEQLQRLFRLFQSNAQDQGWNGHESRNRSQQQQQLQRNQQLVDGHDSSGNATAVTSPQTPTDRTATSSPRLAHLHAPTKSPSPQASKHQHQHQQHQHRPSTSTTTPLKKSASSTSPSDARNAMDSSVRSHVTSSPRSHFANSESLSMKKSMVSPTSTNNNTHFNMHRSASSRSSGLQDGHDSKQASAQVSPGQGPSLAPNAAPASAAAPATDLSRAPKQLSPSSRRNPPPGQSKNNEFTFASSGASNAASRGVSLFQRAPVRRPSPVGFVHENTREMSSDDMSDSESELESENSYASSDEGRLSYHNRSATSTSIVRGFSPSNISVSVINRSPTIPAHSGVSLGLNPPPPLPPALNDDSDSADSQRPAGATASTGVAANATSSANTCAGNVSAFKAPVSREKMFFIESSPSDNEDLGDSVSTTENLSDRPTGSTIAGSVRASARARRATNSPQSPKKLANTPGRSPKLGRTKSDLKRQQLRDVDDEGEDEFEDDDDSAWDSVDDESDSSFDEGQFVVRDEYMHSRPLVKPSRLSSLFLNKPSLVQQQQDELAQRSSRESIASSPRNRSKLGPSIKRSQGVPLNPTENLLNATAQLHAPPPAVAMSPRTTRRNMLATELSSSLRRNLLWERQRAPMYSGNPDSSSALSAEGQPGQAASNHNALKKSHTSTELTGMVSRPGLQRNKSAALIEKENSSSWMDEIEDTNADFNYHARGW